MASVGVTAVSLANNHAMDRGPQGLADTLQAFETAGIDAFGGGSNRETALQPLLIETPYGAVGVVGLGQGYGTRKTAGENRAGTLATDRCTIREAAALARTSGARWVVGFVHWGSNYSKVQHSQEAQARFFADAGYDLVVGHGPHVEQPITSVEGMSVLYSLGNFVFGTPGTILERVPWVRPHRHHRAGAGRLRTPRAPVHPHRQRCRALPAPPVLRHGGRRGPAHDASGRSTDRRCRSTRATPRRRSGARGRLTSPLRGQAAGYSVANSRCICSRPIGPRSSARSWKAFRLKSEPTRSCAAARACSHARSPTL